MNVLFVEHPAFSQHAAELLDDGDLADLQELLRENPELGKVMPGCGGMRKIRLADPRRGKGKRGGLRIIYLLVLEAKWIYLIDIYSKEAKDDVAADDKRFLRRLAAKYRDDALKAKRARRLNDE